MVPQPKSILPSIDDPEEVLIVPTLFAAQLAVCLVAFYAGGNLRLTRRCASDQCSSSIQILPDRAKAIDSTNLALAFGYSSQVSHSIPLA